MRIYKLAAIAATVALTACATTAISTDKAKAAKVVFMQNLLVERPSTGKMTIKRDIGLAGAACTTRIFLDAKPLAELDPGEVFVIYVPAGEYILGAATSGLCGGGDAESQAVVRVNESKTYRVSLDQGMSVRIGVTAQ
ncbi:hypothetical protein CHU94_08140 [Rhodoferax sp. TH121]|uniref:hypothetical protein n=1 Tax=Rhodoferax sp. TH121 TaxID=2022803 RepID=UPI000B96F97F|nr:hypothetical protein [Rhodoferax sp. TH121]OYQ41070.1 hypothetical protein CHU94_08140 [Rhodoferax sp. TH121]